MNELVSIIVPVYNSEKYIFDCIDSVMRQSYANWEMLLIDDGSTDGSKDICIKMGNRDKRILVFHQEHKGAAAARNVGIKAAKGKYLFFWIAMM